MKRCFEKKIRYHVRQKVALRLPRSKGQFFSEKTVDCGGNNTKDSGPSNSLRYLNGCTHCGIGSNSTPMMRIGPAGPKSLCNACGLYWKNTVLSLLFPFPTISVLKLLSHCLLSVHCLFN
uniref:CCT domain-containing protein n=1 Tax=Kalanchoe fedtschenkoi TaxID=63787 RepID=A0A7N0UVF4_KALFE